MLDIVSRYGYISKLLISTAILCHATACQKKPEGILDKEEMATLMADIHMGEAVIDYNYSEFPNDSTRKMLKQSIYDAHGVDASTVDTSFVWYGNHIEEYIKVYDRTIEIIQDRQRDYASAANAQIAIAGDSVDVWNGFRHIIVNSATPSNIITFNMTPDSTWHKGDVYMLRYKPINTQASIKSRLLVDYSNGTTHYVDESFRDKIQNSIKLPIDSTLTPLKVYGYIEIPANNTSTFEIDSLALIRMRHHLIRHTYLPKKTFHNDISAVTTANPDSVTNLDADIYSISIDEQSKNTYQRQTSSNHHRQAASVSNMPESSATSARQTEHRQTASKHKVDRATNAATKFRANHRQQVMQKQQATNEAESVK